MSENTANTPSTPPDDRLSSEQNGRRLGRSKNTIPETTRSEDLATFPTASSAGGGRVFDDIDIASYIEELLAVQVGQLESSLRQTLQEGFLELKTSVIHQACRGYSEAPPSLESDLLPPAEPAGWEQLLHDTQARLEALSLQSEERAAELERLRTALHEAESDARLREERFQSEAEELRTQLKAAQKQLLHSTWVDEKTVEIEAGPSSAPPEEDTTAQLQEALARIQSLEEQLHAANEATRPAPSSQPTAEQETATASKLKELTQQVFILESTMREKDHLLQESGKDQLLLGQELEKERKEKYEKQAELERKLKDLQASLARETRERERLANERVLLEEQIAKYAKKKWPW